MLRSLLHLTTFLVTLIKLYLTLETDQDIINEKYNVKYANLTPYEKQFLDKIVNYDTEENLRYLILNKTQDLYLEHNDELYKQAEENIIFHDDHLKIKFKHHFDTLSLFKNLYYNHVETYFYNKIVYNLLHRLKNVWRHQDRNITAFLAREDQLRERYTRIISIVDYCLRTHYLHVDDSLYRNFFNYSRAHLQKTVYDPLWKQYREDTLEDMFYSAGR
uniref:Uncharacterized protein n=1 Tax=Cacopsylla melanoneura TaxID=428564 RepID=A0A8D9A198_9HEMI